MGNRNLNEYQALEKKIVRLFGSIVITTSGAVYRVKGLGIAGAAKVTGDGKYTITLSDKWPRLMSFAAGVTLDTISAVGKVQVLMAPATLQSTFQTTKTITIQCVDFAGLAVNPEDGSVLTFAIEVRNTTVGNAD